MKSSPKVSIVIPVFNEPKNISKVLAALKVSVPVSYEILVIYDSDNDTTLPVLTRLKKAYTNLHVLQNTIVKGPSGALRTGFKHAKAPLILVTMADLCDDLTQIKELLSLVPKKAAIASPSRYSKGGQQQLKSPFKVFIPKAAGFLLRLLTGLPTNDPTNSYKLYSSKLLKTLRLQSTESFSVTLEIVAKAHVLGYRIVEIPTVWRDRQHGKTNFNLKRSLFPYSRWFLLALLRNRSGIPGHHSTKR